MANLKGVGVVDGATSDPVLVPDRDNTGADITTSSHEPTLPATLLDAMTPTV
jgi:hypothetical protein